MTDNGAIGRLKLDLSKDFSTGILFLWRGISILGNTYVLRIVDHSILD